MVFYFRSGPGDKSTSLIVAMKYDALYTFSNISIIFTFQFSVKRFIFYFHNVNDSWVQNIIMILLVKMLSSNQRNLNCLFVELNPYFSRWFRLITVNLKWMSLNMLNMNIILTRLRKIFVNSWCFLWHTGECLSRIHWIVSRNLKTLPSSARSRRLNHEGKVSDWGPGQKKMDLHYKDCDAPVHWLDVQMRLGFFN